MIQNFNAVVVIVPTSEQRRCADLDIQLNLDHDANAKFFFEQLKQRPKTESKFEFNPDSVFSIPNSQSSI